MSVHDPKVDQEQSRSVSDLLSGELDQVDRLHSDEKNDKESKPDDSHHSQDSERKEPKPWVRWAIGGGVAVVVVVGLIFAIPWIITLMTTVSTDDAYVNGHVTFVAPRVAGLVKEVLVDDNNRVRKGDILVRLDREPFEIQVNLRKSALQTAKADLGVAESQVRGIEAMARAQRWQLQLSIQKVAAQVANLNAAVATYRSRQASLKLAEANHQRGEVLAPAGALSKEDRDRRRQEVESATAAVEEARQQIYAIRVNLGLDAKPDDDDLTAVPKDLEQTYPDVQAALAQFAQSMAQIGRPLISSNIRPRQIIAEYDQRESPESIDRRLEEWMKNSPTVQQASAKVQQVEDELRQAELNLRYCDVVSETDGIVTRRGVNPGNYVDPQQMLMAVRSLTEVWVDANFKESQLSNLRIGQRVRCRVDMYGRKREFEGRLSGFSMGTGAALSVLPPQNASGNFIKIVQRLPVRIDVTDYKPSELPLFVGLSVVPYVYYKTKPTGPHAGEFLQPANDLPQGRVAAELPREMGTADRGSVP